MSYRGTASIYGGDDGGSGSKRKKLAGYLKAANELRQSYSASWNVNNGPADPYGEDVPGAFPDAAVIKGDNEEMILFPGYARKHTKTKPKAEPGTIQEVEGSGRDSRDTVGAGDAEFWKKQWEQYENDKAIVDVDVRGWIYTPHKGPMSRKHRLMVGLARQLSGLPAPSDPSSNSSSGTGSRASSPTRRENEIVSQQAEEIVRKGEVEAEIATRGGFSERPSRDADGQSLYGDRSRNSSPARSTRLGLTSTRDSSNSSYPEDVDPASPVKKRASWTQPAKMSPAELSVANNHLMARLKPFMANAIANTAVSAFFYNDTVSRQRTVYTDASGHFHLRAGLDFVPTHVRILASEKLSATEEVHITSSRGVSLITDIDDTIKHSAITSGAREIFRNCFIRELGDLTIDGVKQWYNTLADMGVKVHYVSNSPWQLYPVITSFLRLAGMPVGSYHLKQYSGMLQGIFEPVAERKKATLERIMHDFPERKFVLMGDSGEADLEVYTDTVLEYPGRILGVFIRDVTTPQHKGFFDPSMGPLSGGGGGKTHHKNQSTESLTATKHLSRPDDIKDDEAELRAAIAASLRDMEEETARTRRSVFLDQPANVRFPGSNDAEEMRPKLPPRRPTDPPAPQANAMEGNLIDFSDDETPLPPPPKRFDVHSHSKNPRSLLGRTKTDMPVRKASPTPPVKPAQLRSPSGEVPTQSLNAGLAKRTPPKPRKSSTTVTTINTLVPSPLSQNSPIVASPPSLPPKRPTHLRAARNKLHSAYNVLPSAPSYLGGSHSRPTHPQPPAEENYTMGPRAMSTASTKSVEDLKPKNRTSIHGPPPPPPRRNLSSYPAAAASYASNRLSGNWGNETITSSGIDGGGGSGSYSPVNKKEELWKRRWARSQEIMDKQGVVLRAWRVGSDVEDVCVNLVRQALREIDESDKDELEAAQRKSNANEAKGKGEVKQQE